MFLPKNRVSAKLALYSHDYQSVLIMRYPIKSLNGIPGGHVEVREDPDNAMARELMEELGVAVDSLKRADFFLTKGRNSRIILAYTAIAPVDVVITPSHPKFEYGEWVSKEELKNTVMSPEYIRFILENWPNG